MSNKKTNVINTSDIARTALRKKTDIQNHELWNFPMDYPMSIIGIEGEKERLLDEVSMILSSLFPDFDLATLIINPSRTGRFHSVRCNIYVTSAEQINELYRLMDEAETIRTVL